jgi:AsmA protein
MRKMWVKVTLAAVALFIVILLLLPLFINADTFRPTLEDQLSAALGRRVTFDHLSLSVFSGSLVADNISIADDPAFSTSAFLQARKLDIGVEVAPLLFHREVRITKFAVDSPAIQLIQSHTGRWNYSSIGGAAASQPATSQQTAVPADLTVSELKIKNGSITVLSIPPTGKPFVYSDVNVGMKQFSFAKSFPFDLSARLPGNGSLTLSGTAGPLAQKDASDTPFQATLHLKQFDPVAAGVIDAGKGISTVADIDAEISSDGDKVASTGKIKAARLQLARTGSPAAQPVDIDYKISDDLDARTGKVSDIAIHTGSVAAHVTGGFRLTAQGVTLDLRLAAPNLPVDQLEQLLPVLGIRVPSGSSLQGGTLTATVAITGPATAATISGPVEIDNTRLAGFDLGSKIQGINPFGGTGIGTEIQTLRATLNASPELTQITDIYGNLPQIGTATGSGTISDSGALDFKMVATLNSSNVVGAIANTAANTVSGFVGSFLHPGAKPTTATTPHGIPLTITGTATNPSIKANVGAMFK